jgi:hypothetical protein
MKTEPSAQITKFLIRTLTDLAKKKAVMRIVIKDSHYK